jgi:hypothetical protein
LLIAAVLGSSPPASIAVDSDARWGGTAGGQGQFGQRVRLPMFGKAVGQGGWVCVTDVIEGDHVDQPGRRGALGLDQGDVGAGGCTAPSVRRC